MSSLLTLWLTLQADAAQSNNTPPISKEVNLLLPFFLCLVATFHSFPQDFAAGLLFSFQQFICTPRIYGNIKYLGIVIKHFVLFVVHIIHLTSLHLKQEELKRAEDAEREKRAAAAERRIAAMAAAKAQGTRSEATSSQSPDVLCSCCHVSLAGKVPFHRYNYKYCSTTCMHLHKEILEDG